MIHLHELRAASGKGQEIYLGYLLVASASRDDWVGIPSSDLGKCAILLLNRADDTRMRWQLTCIARSILDSQCETYQCEKDRKYSLRNKTEEIYLLRQKRVRCPKRESCHHLVRSMVFVRGNEAMQSLTVLSWPT